MPGHTEIFAQRTGAKEYAMLLVDGEMRVVHRLYPRFFAGSV